MMLYVENFAGDLEGVRQRLDYFKECGVKYVHLMPLLDTSEDESRSDGGYAVSNFRKVRADLGTMEDLEKLAGDCHKRGIRICLDFVMNHTSDEHEWARAARSGDPVAQDRYFFYDDAKKQCYYQNYKDTYAKAYNGKKLVAVQGITADEKGDNKYNVEITNESFALCLNNELLTDYEYEDAYLPIYKGTGTTGIALCKDGK